MDDKNERETLTEEFKRINREKFEKFYETICESFDDFLERKSLVKDDWKMKCPYKYGDDYWVILDNGDIESECWDEYETDGKRFNAGNVFPTLKEADLENERRKLLTRFRAFRDECNNGWKADCTDVTQKKYYISYSGIKNGLYVSYIVLGNHLHTFSYFKNEQDAERAIELFGDEIIELYVEKRLANENN